MNIFSTIVLIFALCSTTAYPMQRKPSSLIKALKSNVDRYTIEKMVTHNATLYAQEVSENNQTALMVAILYSYPTILDPLIEAMSPEQLLQRDNRGFNALEYATQKGNIHASILLRKKLQVLIDIPEDFFVQ